MIVRAKSSLISVGLLLILLPVLAVFQYRWIGEVSAAERDRLESSLRSASERFAMDFDAEFSRLANVFQIRDGFPKTADPVIDRYRIWSESNPYPPIVRSIYLLKNRPDIEPEFYTVDLAARELHLGALPADFEPIRDRFRPGSRAYTVRDRILVLAPIFRGGPQTPFAGPQRENFRQFRGEEFRPEPGPGRRQGPGGPLDGETIIELDRDVILNELVPALIDRHFSTHDRAPYRIAIVAQANPPRVLYSSAGEWTTQDVVQPDGSVHLFGGGRGPGFGGRNRGPGPRNTPPGSLMSEPWQLVVKHRAGSLENAVEQVRFRNLAMSFGILLVLAAGLTTLIISSERAHTLGRLQMEFAAGMSHELRTPLAVIRSAAHNLRSGIVREKQDVEEYAKIVQEEARRLSDMVEEVLLYSETQSGRKKYKLEPVDVTDVIDRAIANLSPAITSDNYELQTRIDPDLPPARADASGLTQCVQNLLSNALKYGRSGDTAQIEIVAGRNPASSEIQLSVIDHGPGIDSADQRQLFEPFYRGTNAGSNVPGNGLGLHLVKRIMLAQGGRVTFSPAPQGGSSFTLHIPAAS